MQSVEGSRLHCPMTGTRESTPGGPRAVLEPPCPPVPGRPRPAAPCPLPCAALPCPPRQARGSGPAPLSPRLPGRSCTSRASGGAGPLGPGRLLRTAASGLDGAISSRLSTPPAAKAPARGSPRGAGGTHVALQLPLGGRLDEPACAHRVARAHGRAATAASSSWAGRGRRKSGRGCRRGGPSAARPAPPRAAARPPPPAAAAPWVDGRHRPRPSRRERRVAGPGKPLRVRAAGLLPGLRAPAAKPRPRTCERDSGEEAGQLPRTWPPHSAAGGGRALSATPPRPLSPAISAAAKLLERPPEPEPAEFERWRRTHAVGVLLDAEVLKDGSHTQLQVRVQ